MHVAQFGIKRYTQGLEQPAHRHDQASVSIVLCGSITETVGDSVRLLTAGDVIAKPRGLLHANSYSSPATVASLTLDGDLGDYAVARGCAMATTVRIVDAFRNGESIFDELADLGALLEPAAGNIARPDRGMADIAVELEQTGRPVEEIARRVGMHRVALARAFRRAHGISLTGYRLRARARKAATLLCHSALSLCEIALAAGFADQSHFCRIFRRELGVAPGAYRRLIRDLRR